MKIEIFWLMNFSLNLLGSSFVVNSAAFFKPNRVRGCFSRAANYALRMRVSLILLITTLAAQAAVRQHFGPRHVNQFTVSSGGKTVAIYGAVKGADTVLLTHHRRDAHGKLAGAIVAPAAVRTHFEKAREFWAGFAKKRFHYYAQQSTKVAVEPVAVRRWVKEGDVVTVGKVQLKVLATPGFTRGP
jgi:hypothetical protein